MIQFSNINILSILFISLFIFTCKKKTEPDKLEFEVVQSFQHSSDYFTQGLIWDNDTIIESIGNYGQSKLLKYNLQNGMIYDSIHNTPETFAEGICIFGSEIFQLTWKNKIVYVYDRNSLVLKNSFPIKTEGWGICTDGTHLIVSDGTNTLNFHDPINFKLVKSIYIKSNKFRIQNLNELEYIHGKIYANQWNRDYIYIINPSSGEVESIINLQSLTIEARKMNPFADVLNGIAYNSQSGNLLITGKFWSKLYEIKLKD